MAANANHANGKAADGVAVSACPVERAILVIGGKWKLLLLRSLLLNGPQRYNDLFVSVRGISAKELTRNVRELTVAGLVIRDTEEPVRSARYGLTTLGKGLMPTFTGLLTWGEALLSRPEATNIPVR